MLRVSFFCIPFLKEKIQKLIICIFSFKKEKIQIATINGIYFGKGRKDTNSNHQCSFSLFSSLPKVYTMSSRAKHFRILMWNIFAIIFFSYPFLVWNIFKNLIISFIKEKRRKDTNSNHQCAFRIFSFLPLFLFLISFL